MYDKTDKKYLYYKINSYTYKIKTYGKIFYLIDYGRIRSLKSSRDYQTKLCVRKNTDINSFSKVILNMYLFEIIKNVNINKLPENNIYKNIRKKYIEKTEHDILENKRKYLYILYKKNIINLNLSKLYIVDDKIFDFMDEIKKYRDLNIFTKFFSKNIDEKYDGKIDNTFQYL
jgi:hypothetical protein